MLTEMSSDYWSHLQIFLHARFLRLPQTCGRVFLFRWQSGYAQDCKSCYVGSIPAWNSNAPMAESMPIRFSPKDSP